MSDSTFNFSKSLKTSALLTLFLLSSVPAFAAQVDNQEDVSITPSIQPSNIPSVQAGESEEKDLSTPLPNVAPSILPEEGDVSVPPTSAPPSVQAVNPELQRLKEELEIAQLRQQLAEQKMLTQATEKKLAEEEAARLTAQQYTSPSPAPMDPLETLIHGLIGGRSNARVDHNVSTELIRGAESWNNFFSGKGWKSNRRLEKDYKKQERRLASQPLVGSSSQSSPVAASSVAPSSSIPNPAFKEPESPSLSAAGTPRTFRTTGENPNARSKHSATSLQLRNKDLQGAAYELIVNHRTRQGKTTQVRVYNPKMKDYNTLGTLPASSVFRNTSFKLSSWAQAVRDDSAIESDIKTFLSFRYGTSDIHSFRIQSPEGEILKEVVFGNDASEKQLGVHVYAPETDPDANEWSAIRQ